MLGAAGEECFDGGEVAAFPFGLPFDEFDALLVRAVYDWRHNAFEEFFVFRQELGVAEGTGDVDGRAREREIAGEVFDEPRPFLLGPFPGEVFGVAVAEAVGDPEGDVL